MAGISSKALKWNYPENQKKYNGVELDTAFGLDVYEAELRYLDPQVGRWWQGDPKIESMELWSPYASNYDNPIRYNDPLGDEGKDCCSGFIIETGKWLSDKLDRIGNSKPVRWTNENLNILTPVVELVTGKSNASDYTQDKSRIESGVQLATFVVPGGKAEAAIANEAKNLVVSQVEKKLVSLDNNALTAAIKEGKKDLVKQSIGADKPIVSITAAKEYLVSGTKAELKGFMKEIGATISKKGGSASQSAALQQTASSMGRSLGKNDAMILAGAMNNNAAVMTADKKFTNFMKAIGFPTRNF